jgi:microcystin degradation protein MlrC
MLTGAIVFRIKRMRKETNDESSDWKHLSRVKYLYPVSGISRTLQESGIELVLTLGAVAMPGGVVERSAYEHLKQTLLDKAHDIDGVCLFLHGAMRAEGLDYAEADLLRALRAQIGPDVPITIALDMHANIVAEMAEHVDALAAYHRSPHIDMFETGQKAAQILLRMLNDGLRPAIGFTKVPFLLPGEMTQTALEPMKSMVDMVEAIEQRPEVLSASLAVGHCWADVPDIGIAAVVITDGDAKLAQSEADRLASSFWERRAEFGVSAEAYPPQEAVAKALAAPESPLFLCDSGDNPGAGGTTDVPALLGELIAQEASGVLFASIWDAEAVQCCIDAGVGTELTLSVGGKLDTAHGTPLEITGRVRLLIDGDTYRGGVRQRWGRYGPIAVVNVNGIDVILSSTRLSILYPGRLRERGLSHWTIASSL